MGILTARRSKSTVLNVLKDWTQLEICCTAWIQSTLASRTQFLMISSRKTKGYPMSLKISVDPSIDQESPDKWTMSSWRPTGRTKLKSTISTRKWGRKTRSRRRKIMSGRTSCSRWRGKLKRWCPEVQIEWRLTVKVIIFFKSIATVCRLCLHWISTAALGGI